MLSQSALAWVAKNKFFLKCSSALALFGPAHHHEHNSCSAALADVLSSYISLGLIGLNGGSLRFGKNKNKKYWKYAKNPSYTLAKRY